jgi:dTDP-L-rhamnose 4-epimerase
MERLAIIGGAGFIGKNLCERLEVERNEYLVIDCFDKQIHGSHTHIEEQKFRRKFKFAELVVEDFASEESFQKLKEFEPDTIVYLASQTGTSDGNVRFKYYNKENCTKFLALVAFLDECHFETQFMLTSSRAVYGDGFYLSQEGDLCQTQQRTLSDLSQHVFSYSWERQGGTFVPHSISLVPNPISFYGTTKLFQESVLRSVPRNAITKTTIVRLQNVVGRYQSIYNPYTGLLCWFYNQMLKNETVEIYENSEITRDFVDVRSVTNLLNDLKRSQQTYSLLDFGHGEQVPLRIIAEKLKNELNSSSRIIDVPKFREGDCKFAEAAVGHEELHYLTYSLEETLRDFINKC